VDQEIESPGMVPFTPWNPFVFPQAQEAEHLESEAEAGPVAGARPDRKPGRNCSSNGRGTQEVPDRAPAPIPGSGNAFNVVE